nr:hypothetical protein CFP56_39792 [Quercus suber]
MGNLEKWSDPSTRFLFPFCELLTVKKFLFFVLVEGLGFSYWGSTYATMDHRDCDKRISLKKKVFFL